MKPYLLAQRRLERATLANLFVHLAAMVSMALLLAPFLPGGGVADDGARVLRLAEHPWLFRLGWLPWHLCALIDLVFAVALLRAKEVARGPAWVTFALTVLAVIPDQGAQLLWITKGASLAREAVLASDLRAYLAFEKTVFYYGSGVAPCLYTLGAIGWTLCFRSIGVWSPGFARFSLFTWLGFAIISAAPVLPPGLRPSSALIAGGNAVCFLLLIAWLVWAAELLFRRVRPFTRSGAHARWRAPQRGLLGKLLELVANSRFLRGLGESVPSIGFRSDITDVVYVNYLVLASELERLVPEGLKLQRIGRGDDYRRYALFTFLTYRHGHFGPTLLGSLRRLFPSPVHTNWRIHVEDPVTGVRGVHFITNAIASIPLALGARLMTEGMPMHLLSRGELERQSDGHLRVLLDPGLGSGPDAELALEPAEAPSLSPPWSACFNGFSEFLLYCVPQDRAMSTQSWAETVVRQEIALGIAIDDCEPLRGVVTSRAARAIVGDAEPLCFRVARVSFAFTGEAHDARGQ